MLNRAALVVFACFLCVTAAAQSIPTATLTGKVTSTGAELPGVTVSVSSPNLQGVRTTVTSEAGDYLFALLPPGDYTVRFELAGLDTATRRVTLSATRTDRLDLDLKPAALEEAITVTADTPVTAALESTQVSANFKQDFFEKLPVLRNLTNITQMAPGVTPNGPGGNIMISGAVSYDSLYLINGAIVNENLRGQPHGLFIEDAIQETTVMTGAISAEYGHFTGGVVNAITKSGGNEFSGSVRDFVTSESWNGETIFTEDQSEEVNHQYEGTLGGPFMRDRVWFFGAGRYVEAETIQQTSFGGRPLTGDVDPRVITYPRRNEELRLEGKITGSITPRHNIVASYLDVDDQWWNTRDTTGIDLSVNNEFEEEPNTLLAVNYNGSLSNRFFVEAQYSEKEFTFLGGGARFNDLIRGTRISDRTRGVSFNSPVFRFQPEGEQRDHQLFTVKGTYFWSTQQYGSHDIKVGYEDFMEMRKVNNYQGGSDYSLSINSTIIRGDQIFPRMLGGSTSTQTRIIWQPIFELSQGSEYNAYGVFLNDTWSLNEHWTFNIGARWDKNDAISAGHSFQIADDSAISPRLSAHYDVYGNGRLVANASFNQYVGRLAEGVGNDADAAGRTASLQWYYRGPSINSNVNAPTEQLVPTAEALQRVFDWFFQQGGTNTRPTRSVSIPGVDTIIDPDGLKSPKVREWTLGLGSAIGSRGHVRADVVYRDWADFYVGFNSPGSTTTDQFGNVYDLSIIRNSDIQTREYTGVHTLFSWRPARKLNLGGSYTWSRLTGNATGENSGNGPTTSGLGEYREYWEHEWSDPQGYLTADQRHRLRAWASYDLTTPMGVFNITLLQNFDSGQRTSTDDTIDIRGFVPDLGYENPPDSVTYFFGGRGDVKHEDVTRTDLALNYSKKFGKVELIFQPEVINLFNEQAVLSVNETIFTSLDPDRGLQKFNPFTETPIECPQGAPASQCEAMGAHWQKGDAFGEPDSEGDFQQVRTVRFSVGVRF